MLVMSRVARARWACARVFHVLTIWGLMGLSAQVLAQSVTYQYNAKGQVFKATYPNGTVVTYAYDNNGNRLSATATPDTTPPNAPGAVTGSSVTGDSAVISWGAATDPNVAVTGYQYQVNGGSWIPVSSGTSVDLTGLTPGDTITVSVAAINAAGIIGPPTTTTFNLPPTAPGVPTASNVTGSSVTVSWTAASSSAGITGYSYQLDAGTWSSFSNTLSVNLTGLTYGTAYTIGVRAKDANGSISTVATGTFATGPTAPGIPTASSITGTSATVSWTAASDSLGVTGYSYQVNGGAWSAFSNTLSVSLTGLAYGTTYTVGVRAHDNAGNLGATATGSFTTPPSAPVAPTASNITGTTATVSWGAATGANGVSGYRYQLNGGAWSNWSAALSVNLTGLSYGTSYTIGVEAEDAAGHLGAIATGTFATPPGTPGVPAISNITGASATATWTAAPAGSGIIGYGYQLNGGSWSGWSTATTVSLTGLAYGTNYTFGVRAKDANNNIGATATASFTTAPSAPGTLAFSSIGPTTAHVAWTAAASAVGVSAYRYSINGGSTWTSAGTALAVNLTGLALGTTYTVLVQAQSASGIWSASSSGSFTTLSYYTDTFAYTAGTLVSYQTLPTGQQVQIPVGVGYSPANNVGSLSPTKTSNGLTVASFFTANGMTGLTISGFGSNPGAAWLGSLSGASYSITGASATFSYSGNTASWTWTGSYATQSGTLTMSHK